MLYLSSFNDDETGNYDILNTGELVYKISQMFLFIVPAIFFLFIPRLIARGKYDEPDIHTYSFVATSDGTSAEPRANGSLNRNGAI
jgi:hypothetical protein